MSNNSKFVYGIIICAIIGIIGTLVYTYQGEKEESQRSIESEELSIDADKIAQELAWQTSEISISNYNRLLHYKNEFESSGAYYLVALQISLEDGIITGMEYEQLKLDITEQYRINIRTKLLKEIK